MTSITATCMTAVLLVYLCNFNGSHGCCKVSSDEDEFNGERGNRYMSYTSYTSTPSDSQRFTAMPIQHEPLSETEPNSPQQLPPLDSDTENEAASAASQSAITADQSPSETGSSESQPQAHDNNADKPKETAPNPSQSEPLIDTGITEAEPLESPLLASSGGPPQPITETGPPPATSRVEPSRAAPEAAKIVRVTKDGRPPLAPKASPSQIANSGAKDRILTVGAKGQTAISGTKKRTRAAGAKGQTASSGAHDRIPTVGTKGQTTISGTKKQTRATGAKGQTTSSGAKDPTPTVGTKSQTANSGTRGRSAAPSQTVPRGEPRRPAATLGKGVGKKQPHKRTLAR